MRLVLLPLVKTLLERSRRRKTLSVQLPHIGLSPAAALSVNP